MGRGFSEKSKIGKHNESYSVHPDKNILNAMGWKKGDFVKVIPIPSEGIICLKGKKVSDKKFLNSFYYNLLKKINEKDVKRTLRKINSLIRKFEPLDIIAYQEAFSKIIELRDQLRNIVRDWEVFLSKQDEVLRKRFDIPVGKYS